jgi:hypothetical protein
LEPTGIEEVKERAKDLSKALREAGAEDVAARIDKLADDFVDASTVRRAVEAIRQQLRHFRAYPEELPEQPVVHIAANRLEDACKTALRAGRIEPARLSLRAQSRRKLWLVVLTFLGAGLVLGVPLALAMAGVDFSDWPRVRTLPLIDVPRGAARSVRVNVLEESRDPRNTTAVVFYVEGRCPVRLSGGMSCRDAGERTFGSRKLHSYEVMLRDEAYGLLLGFDDAHLVGAVGTATLWVMATAETPLGLYEVPLAAEFTGYAPERCDLLLSLSSQCVPKRSGGDARDPDHGVPVLRVQVVPEGAQQDSPEAVAAAPTDLAARALAERVQQLTAMVEPVRTALDETQRYIRRKQFEQSRTRLDELSRLFEPLDALVVATPDDAALPADLLGLRARFDSCVREQNAFEQRAFDAAYAALSKRRGAQTDDAVIARVARQYGISSGLLERIYAEHAEQIEQRIKHAQDAEKQAQERSQAALLARCGPLPTAAFRAVQAYLSARAVQLGVRLRMRECMTPRLSDAACWSVVCGFDDVVSRPDRFDDALMPRQWTFELHNGRVLRHREHSR